jgi:two-component system sensor histidine kinase MprB
VIRWLGHFVRHRAGPLQSRLAGFITATATGTIAVTGIAAYLFTTLTVYSQLDSELIGVARLTSEWISGDIENLGGLNTDALKAANVTMQVVRSDGQLIPTTSSLDITAQEVAIARLQAGTSARTGEDMEHTVAYRIVAVPLTDGARNYALVLGRPLDPTFQILRIMGVSLLGFGMMAIMASAALGWVIARHSLAPLQKLNVAVTHVAETDKLDPIPLEGMHDLAGLTRSFNTMMESLASSRERQRQLIDDAGHELRTPLTALRTNVELLVADEQQGMLPPGARAEILRDMAAQLGEFTALIGDLVHLSRDDAVRPAPEPIDLTEVVERALDRARRRGPNLRYDVRLEPFYLLGDSALLERAITNLLDNAVKFSPPDGAITVRMVGDRLTISDEGAGIDPADLPHVFDRFYRSDKSRNTPGSGLGLSIVQQTIKSHGGWVRADNSPVGGAVFTVRLPGSSEPPAAVSD